MSLLQSILTGLPGSGTRNTSESQGVEIELTRILYSYGLRANVVIFCAIFFIILLFKEYVHLSFLIPWGICTGVLVLARLFLIRKYTKQKPDFCQNRKYLYIYLVSVVAITLCWTSLIYTGMRLPEFEHRVFFLMLLLAILGTAVVSLSSNLTALYIYLLVPSIPIIPLLLLSEQKNDVAMGVVLAFFLYLMVKMGHDMFNVLKSYVEMRYELEKARDTLEEKVAERTRDLRESRDMAEKANRAKSVFLATMSHEIRTPMNVIINLSQLALQEKMSSKVQGFVSKVHSSGKNLLGIINDILDISKIESGKLTLEEIDFDMEKVITDVVAGYAIKAEDKGLEYQVHIEPELKNYFTGDPLRIRQVLSNLIDNSIKFTEQGSVIIRGCCIEQDTDRAVIELRITDTGIGISTEQRKKLFRQFQQADDSTTRKYGGTGLGLVISMQLVNLMGGIMDVESKYGTGSTFFVRIPFQYGKEQEQRQVDQEEFDLEILAPLAGKKILVVDDVVPNQVIITSVLENIGVASGCAINGREALVKLEKERFDLVFLDVQMPEMDGYETVKMIRKNAKLRDLPVIAMTANVLPEDVQKSLDAGMDQCLLKPLNLVEVYRVLEKYLLKNRDA